MAAESSLKVELSNTLAEHSITGVNVVVEIEGIAQIAWHPYAVAEGIFQNEEIPVEPARGFLQAGLELGARAQLPHVIDLCRKLAGEGVGLIALAQDARAGDRTRLRQWLLPEYGAVFVPGPVESDFG